MLNRILGIGPAQFFKGLRQGDVPLMFLGATLLLIRLSRRKRNSKATSLTLKAGESVALRVTSPGADPVIYRLDA